MAAKRNDSIYSQVKRLKKQAGKIKNSLSEYQFQVNQVELICSIILDEIYHERKNLISRYDLHDLR